MRRKVDEESQNNRINEIFENDINKTGKLDKKVFFKVFKKLILPLGEGDNEKEFQKIACRSYK